MGLNDAFKAVSRYWDRITHPAQIIQSLPAAIATMLDPADCGPAFLGLPQDVQGWTYDYPLAFFDEQPIASAARRRTRVRLPMQRRLISAQRPVIIAGGGVQYSRAVPNSPRSPRPTDPCDRNHRRSGQPSRTHPLNIGPVGVTGSNSANTIAEKADVILRGRHRLQDFTTGSWTAFDKAGARSSGSTPRGMTRQAPVAARGGRCQTWAEALDAALGGYKAPADWTAFAQAERKWDAYVPTMSARDGNRPNSYAQAIGVVNALCDPRDRVVTAAGGLPAEVTANWRTLDIGTVDVEFGFSCMGYEIAGGWGARIAQSSANRIQDTIVFVGDGSYLLMNSDIYSSVLSKRS
jgi:3D-(3,5/4)-trihydroxycyclohexane-1,2-dione acylhydrolase (decyclizing)